MTRVAGIHERTHQRLVLGRRVDRLAEALLAELPVASTVLDLGCGSGMIGARLAAAGHTVVGVETLAREECAIPWAVYDGRRLPVRTDGVDWVTIVDVLHHADDPRAVLEEAARVARRGILLKDHFAETARHRWTLAMMDWVGNHQFGVGRDGEYLSRRRWDETFAACSLAPTSWNLDLDLYPGVAKPIFERGLHFVARLESVDG